MELYGSYTIKGYKVTVFGWNKEKERIIYEACGKIKEAKQHYVCPFGGNPFPGTIIEYYNIILPNGKKARLTVRA